MKLKQLFFAVVLAMLALNLFAQPSMTPEKWVEDMDYLNRKFQKTFASFIPGIKVEFEKEINALKERIPQLKDHEIEMELMRILAGLHDGHTELNVGQKNTGFHRLPFVFYFFDGELRIINAHEKQKEFLGAKVLQLGHGSAMEVFEKLKLIQSHDNEMEFLHSSPGYLKMTEVISFLGFSESPTSTSIVIEKMNGDRQTLSFEGLPYDEYMKGPWAGLLEDNKVDVPLYLQHQQRSYWHEYVEENKMMYFHFSRVNNQKSEPSIKKYVKQLFEEVDNKHPELFVIDLRNNNGGNYHLSRPLIEAIKARPWLNQSGKVWAITGRTTFSAASVTTIFLKRETNTQLIGEAGRTDPNLTDNIEYLELPNSKLTIEYTTRIKKHWPELTTNYIPVDVEVKVTFEQYRQGVDPVIEYLMKEK